MTPGPVKSDHKADYYMSVWDREKKPSQTFIFATITIASWRVLWCHVAPKISKGMMARFLAILGGFWVIKPVQRILEAEKGLSKEFPFGGFLVIATLPKTNIAMKIGLPKRKLVFKPSIFRCYVSFGECNPKTNISLVK